MILLRNFRLSCVGMKSPFKSLIEKRIFTVYRHMCNKLKTIFFNYIYINQNKFKT